MGKIDVHDNILTENLKKKMEIKEICNERWSGSGFYSSLRQSDAKEALTAYSYTVSSASA